MIDPICTIFEHRLSQGRMQDFSGGEAQLLKKNGFWVYMPRSAMSRAAKVRAVARGFGGMLPQEKILKSGAISCILWAIFNHFHDKKSSQKNYK